MINIDEMNLKLLLSLPIDIDGLKIYSPSLKSVIAIGYENYNRILSSWLFDKNKVPDLEKMEQSNLNFIIYFYEKDPDFRNHINTGSKLLFKEEVSVIFENNSPSLYIGDIRISSELLNSVQAAIKISNKIPDKVIDEEFNPANSKAEEFIKKIMGDRAKKPQKKQVNNLHSLISGLSWKSNNISILDIGELSIYQFYDGYYRLENIDHYNNIMTGIYNGNIDSTKIKIQENSWAKIID